MFWQALLKKLKKDIKCYSIVDNDQRYNEQKNINISKKFLNCKTRLIKPNKHKNIKKLEKLIKYHESQFQQLTFWSILI